MRGALALILALSSPAAAQAPIRVALIDTAPLRSPRLTESSGVAPSLRSPGVLWTHNDSGDEPRIYATDSMGDDLGWVRVSGATNVDWEDMASGPCPGRADPCLWMADIGDNRHRRDHIVVYRLLEPQPPRRAADTLRAVPFESARSLRYPDHPHDAEALAVLPSGEMLIITKELLGAPQVYRVPPERVSGRRDTTDTLGFVGLLDIAPSIPMMRLVTGAAVSPNGSVLAVRTYSSIHFFRLRGDSLPAPLTPPTGILLPVVEPQGEAVAFLAPDRLVLTTELGDADHAIVSRLRVTGLPEGHLPH